MATIHSSSVAPTGPVALAKQSRAQAAQPNLAQKAKAVEAAASHAAERARYVRPAAPRPESARTGRGLMRNLLA